MLPTPLSFSQRVELLRAKNSSEIHPKKRERIEMVLLADAGWENRQIARHLGKGESTVQIQVRAFIKGGLESLGVHYGEDRKPRKATAEFLQAAEAKLDEDRIWTAPQLVKALAEETGVTMHKDHLSKLLKQRGFSWKRTKKSVAHSRKPEVFEAKSEALASLKKISR